MLLLSAGLAAAQTTTTPSQPTEAAPPPGAIPQEPPPSGVDAHAPGKPMEEQITVTGSRVRRKDLTTPAPVTVLTRQQWQESGKLTIGEFLQTLPEQGNAPNFQLNNGGATYGADGSTRVSLRSLGVTRTLVLVNGRRMVNAGLGASSSVDLNSIPTAAVERIEVLKDGASAIYGSDAIAGVVNVITRRNYNGTELAAQYGSSTKGDAQTFDAQVTAGRSGELGNFVFSAGYFKQGDSWLRDRDWSQFALTYDYLANSAQGEAQPGGSSRVPQGAIRFQRDSNGDPLPSCTATSLCGRLLAQYPSGVTFIRDPAAPLGWRPFVSSGTPNDTYNFAADNYLTIPSERIQVYSSGDTRLGFARGYFEASYVQRHTQQNAAPMPLNPGDYTFPGTTTAIFVSQDSMYNPFGTDLSFSGRRLVEFGNRTYTQDLGTFRVVTGVDGTLPDELGPARGWYWDASVNYGRTSGTFTTGGAIRNSKVAAAVGPSTDRYTGTPTCYRDVNDPNSAIPGCVPINLFGGPNNGSITAEQIAGLGFTGTSRAQDELFTVDANLTGDLFPLLGNRPVSLALGYEFRRQAGEQIADPIAASGDSADFNFTSTRGQFHANEGYAELSIPILANVPFVQELEASVAGRYVNYNTFGGKFTYKLGARYTPIPDVTVRGTFSTAFRAPSVSELYLGQTETAPTVRDPCGDLTTAPASLRAQCTGAGVPAIGSGDIGNQELAHVGGNANLKAESARIFTAGVVLQPQMIRGFSITLDYYNITVDDPVGNIGLATILNGCYPGDRGTPNPDYCSLITRSTAGNILFVNDFNTNLGQMRTAGLDLALRYAVPTPVGRVGLFFDGNWLAYFDRDQGQGAPTIHGKGTYDLGALPEYKFNVGGTWSLAGFTAGLVGRYIGTFKECSAFDYDAGSYLSVGGLCWLNPSAPSRQVGHNFVVDLNASYTLPSPLGRTTLALGINNVFDQAPQFVYAAPLANSDPSAYDYIGRFVYGRIQHTF